MFYFLLRMRTNKPVRAILRQWPDLYRRMALCRCFGIENLPKDKLLKGLLVDGNLGVSAVVHRDRDFMTTEEVERWKRAYKTDRTFPWVCANGDVEAYFCQADYLASLYGIDLDTAKLWREEACNRVSKTK